MFIYLRDDVFSYELRRDNNYDKGKSINCSCLYNSNIKWPLKYSQHPKLCGSQTLVLKFLSLPLLLLGIDT